MKVKDGHDAKILPCLAFIAADIVFLVMLAALGVFFYERLFPSA
jgi:hypothetical protein